MYIPKPPFWSSYRYDEMFDFLSDISAGWKISIQGKTRDDIVFLWERISDFLKENKINFKVATQKRLDLQQSTDLYRKGQGFKVFTIYCSSEVDVHELAEAVYSLTMDYKGWYDIPIPKMYEHYAGGLYIRNDRDKSGRYVSTK